MNNAQTAPKVTKETKNKIRVDFERTPFWDRVKAKLVNLYTLKKVVWYLFRFLLLLGSSRRFPPPSWVVKTSLT